MLSAKVFFIQIGAKSIYLWMCVALLILSSCNGKSGSKSSGMEDTDTISSEETEAEQDTLVYDVVDAPLTEAVDESFLDFFYTFMNRRGFQLQRVVYPIRVKDFHGNEIEVLKSGKSVNASLDFGEVDYLVMLIHEDTDPYDYLSLAEQHAEIKQVTIPDGACRSFAFDRYDDGWKFTGIHLEKIDKLSNFLAFYHSFVNDEAFRNAHLDKEIYVSMPSDENEMETIDGNISSDQWDAFAPELPVDKMLILDLGESADDQHGVKFVRCGIASSMLDVLTFKKISNEWKLERYEE